MLRVATIAVILWAGLLLVTSVEAQTTAVPATGPQQLVEQTSNEVLDVLSKRRAELEKDHSLIYSLTSKIVAPHFDFISISKWVLGKNWRRASKEQKLRFIKAFRQLMIRTYGVAILEYDDNKIKYIPLRDDISKGDVTVRTEFLRPGKAAVNINYSLHLKKDAWKVYDVSVDGVSIVATFRTSFATEVRQSSLDALIERIENKNTDRETPKG